MRAPPKRRNPAGANGGARKSDWLAGKSEFEDTLSRSAAQRRLALKIAAGAGLSLAVASVVVVLALGDGGAR